MMKDIDRIREALLSISTGGHNEQDGPRNPHPLVKFIRHEVVIQQQMSPVRMEGLLVTFDQGYLTLVQACVTGTKFTVRPKNGEIVMAAQAIAHIHREAQVIQEGGGL